MNSKDQNHPTNSNNKRKKTLVPSATPRNSTANSNVGIIKVSTPKNDNSAKTSNTDINITQVHGTEEVLHTCFLSKVIAIYDDKNPNHRTILKVKSMTTP